MAPTFRRDSQERRIGNDWLGTRRVSSRVFSAREEVVVAGCPSLHPHVGFQRPAVATVSLRLSFLVRIKRSG